MKNLLLTLVLISILIACQPPVDNSAQIAFEQNSKTVMKYLEGFQAEDLDWSIFADNYFMGETMYGAKDDSVTLEELKEMQPKSWELFDFKLVETPDLLPGVNAETKQLDGSVRYYGAWEVTRSATDSTEDKSGIVQLYETFDFDENGKIVFSSYYGDIGGLVKDLYSNDESEE